MFSRSPIVFTILMLSILIGLIEAGGNTVPLLLKVENRQVESKSMSDFHPPFCFTYGSRLTFNVVGSCEHDCPDGYDKHQVSLSDHNDKLQSFCCCGECI